MLDGTRFQHQKSVSTKIVEIFSLIFDVVICWIVLVPLSLRALVKEIQGERKEIRGKLALVTGGGNGLGRAICLKLADHGCNVAVADVNFDAAKATAEKITSKGLKSKAYKVDVTKADEIMKLRDELCNDLGPIDILVNNAGLMSNRNMEDSPEYLELMIKVNLLGPVLMTKYFLEQMKKQKSGHIATISSMSGLHPTPFACPYSATKAGVGGFMAGLTEHLRLEGWRSRIKTTCIFPYFIKTRQEVIDSLNPNIRFPPLEVEETAHEAVEGILREDFVVTIPRDQKRGVKLMNVFPLVVQEYIRDRILRIREFPDPTCTLNFDEK